MIIDVSLDTKRQVGEVISRLGYQPSHLAQLDPGQAARWEWSARCKCGPSSIISAIEELRVS
jgi:hypothetical protein